jgi:hypothetical protein
MVHPGSVLAAVDADLSSCPALALWVAGCSRNHGSSQQRRGKYKNSIVHALTDSQAYTSMGLRCFVSLLPCNAHRLDLVYSLTQPSSEQPEQSMLHYKHNKAAATRPACTVTILM